MEAILSLAGCAGRAEVGLSAPGLAAPATVALAAPTARSDLLLRAVAQLLSAADLPPQALKLVVVTRGPGSFTGIRNALACALGLSQALGIPAHGFSSLLVQAARTTEREVVAVQPARKGWVYIQRFVRNATWEPKGGITSVPLVALREEELPVVGPAGVSLPPGAPEACTTLTTPEALLRLAQELVSPDPVSLVPTYVDDHPGRQKAHGSTP